MEILIRKAVPQDYADLCALFDQVDALHRDRLPWLFRKPEGPGREVSEILAWLEADDVALFVAEVGGKLAGFIHAYIRESPPYPIFFPRRWVNIDTMVVDRVLQRKGIGGALMGKVHQWAEEKGATSIELSVYAFNREAIAFYQAQGYKVVRHLMSKSLG
jgi:GNAT superfamily N-acetyltransferase